MTQPELKSKLVYWLRLFAFTVIATYLGIIVLSAITMTLGFTVPLKGSVCCFTEKHEDVHFQTSDGLTLSGWYVPTKNGAVIILLHPYYGNRRGALPIAEMLIRHGYGVLLYDQRASGESEGELRTLGRLDIPDVAQAVALVQSRPGVDRKRIGVYGCSMGGAIALAAAAQNPAIAAVAADAPSPLAFNEAPLEISGPNLAISLPVTALSYFFISLRAGSSSLIPTGEAARAIAPRPLLLISSGQPGEGERVESLYQIAGEPKSRWNIPDAGHCSGSFVHPDEYEQHLVDFFDKMLK